MKKRLFCLVLSLTLLLAPGCAPAEKAHSKTLLAMDTVMELTAYGKNGDAAVEAAAECILELESRLSVTETGSEISRANRGEAVSLSPDTAALLRQTLQACAATGGALDLTIYPVVREWGFTTGDYKVPDGGTLTALLDRVDYRQVSMEDGLLSLPAGVELDLGAAAKGWTGDKLMLLFQEYGITSAMLSLGGNVHVLGSKPDGSPWRIAIRDPSGEGYAGIVEVTDRAVVTSGGYERYFEQDGVRYWHILDPATGYPARSGLASATVVCTSGTWADLLSTAFFVMGAEKAAQYWRDQGGGFEFILIGEDGTVTVTEGLSETFSLYGEWEGHPLEVVTKRA